jgi:Bacterial toxin 30
MTTLRLDQMIVPQRPTVPTRLDFENGILYQATPHILSGLIPQGTPNSYVPGPRTNYGFKFEWTVAGVQWKVWGHDADRGATPGTIAATEWTFRVQSGSQFLAAVGYGTGPGAVGAPSRWWGGAHAEKTHILLEP